MQKSYKKQKNLLIVLILTTLFTFVSSVSFYIYKVEKNHFEKDINQRLESEVDLLGNYLGDLIIRHDYAELKNYLNRVIEKNNKILSLQVKLSNEIKLFSYMQEHNKKYISYKKSFKADRKKFYVESSHDITILHEHLINLKIVLSLFVFIFTVVSGYILWYILSKWILKPLNEEIKEKTKKINNYSNYLNEIIDSLSSHIAIIDENGIIKRTNKAWADFAIENGYKKDPSMIGEKYFQSCNLDSNDCNDVYENGILKVFLGKEDVFVGDYGCDTLDKKRWFNIHAKRFKWNKKNYVIISHEDITNVKEIQGKLEKINKSYTALSQSNMALVNSETEEELLNNVTKIIHDYCGYKLVWIGYKCNDEEKNVKLMASHGKDEGYLSTLHIKWSDCNRGNGPTGKSIRLKNAIVINDSQNDPSFLPWKEEAKSRGYMSIAAFPMFVENDVIGSITVYSDKTNSFLEEEVYLLSELARNLAFGIISLRDKKKVEILSITDQLTGIFNRRNIMEELNKEINRFRRYKEPLSIMLLDIDYFKSVNDTFGHQVGDIVLQEFTKVINQTIRSTDIFGRWGGEEFILILPDSDINSAVDLGERIRKNISEFSFTQVGNKTISIGVTEFNSSDEINTLIERCDKALYEAKSDGRNRVIQITL